MSQDCTRWANMPLDQPRWPGREEERKKKERKEERYILLCSILFCSIDYITLQLEEGRRHI